MVKRQYSTRRLLKVITVLSIFLAVVAGLKSLYQQRVIRSQAERILFSHGGTTSHASALASLRSDGEDRWNWFELKFCNYVEYIDCSVNSWPRLEREAKDVGSVPNVDDDAVRWLATFKRLKLLNLRGTDISDSGLKSLLKLGDLEKVDVSGTRVTAKGMDAFRSAHPGCELINDPLWTQERSPLCEMYWTRKKMGLLTD